MFDSHKQIAGSVIALLFFLLPCGACAGETVLHVFQHRGDGAFPQAGLVGDGAGNLYGTTPAGGTHGCIDGCGTVFKISSDSTETIFYDFCGQPGCSDGATPYAGLIIDMEGNLYGTTTADGQNGGGTVFKLAPDGTETTLYAFCSESDCADGKSPRGRLIMDGSGNLYGTTIWGGDSKCRYSEGQGCGTVFKLSPDGVLTVLHAFKGRSDGAFPLAGVIMDTFGNLEGTTYRGGGSAACGEGCGSVFSVTQSGSETVIYTFQDGADGGYPMADLLADSSGDFYGTTRLGGTHGAGTVFKIAANGTETVPLSFCALEKCNDGAEPRGGVIADKAGNFYGTTFYGGGHFCKKNGGVGCGTVFKLAPDGTETVLYSFTGGSDARNPVGGVIADGAGNLYGATELGGKGNRGYGTVFEVSK